MASPYIIPAPAVLRTGRGRVPRAETETTKRSSGIPIGAAIAVLIGVMVLSKGR